MNISQSGVICHVCTSTHRYQSAYEILKCLVSPIPKIQIDSDCVQNLKIQLFPEIRLGPQTFKWVT